MEFNATMILAHLVGDYLWQNDYMAAFKGKYKGVAAFHALVYTFAIALFLLPQALPFQTEAEAWTWGLKLGAVFLTHFVIDHYGLARKWMRSRLVGQAGFADKMSPWSVIIVDNTGHLLTLFFLWPPSSFMS